MLTGWRIIEAVQLAFCIREIAEDFMVLLLHLQSARQV